uniref:Plastid transcriptionally active 6 n=1 Tax=Aegilops tauschii subsp. strangulata TaxID=200361 RepID=A0A453KDK3_AEGTS
MATTPLATASPYPFPSLLSKTLNPTSTSKLSPAHSLSLSLLTTPAPLLLPRRQGRRQRDISAAYGDGDMDDDFGDAGDFDLDGDDGVGDDDDLDNEQDYDVDYDRLLAPVKPRPQLSGVGSGGEEGEGDIAMVAAESFVSTGASASDTVVDYTVDEDEFHKIRLLHCDFFIRKVPDPDQDVYDFREMYVTPPDTDIYSIPRVLAPMPQKVHISCYFLFLVHVKCIRLLIVDFLFEIQYVRCVKKNFGRYHVSEPPVEHLRDPLYKTEREIMKVFLTKHYRNRRFSDTDFFLDFEEIYVIDSKTRSITRAKVVVNVPEGKRRDRRNDLLLIRDGGESFRITDKSQRDDASTIIQREEWTKSRQDVEKHFRKLRDFDYSNWF